MNDAVFEKLRRGNLNKEITSLVFDLHDRQDTNDAKEEEVIDKLCEGLELLKTNTHIRDLSIHGYLRYDKEKEDAKRVERAYVKFGEYLAANKSVQELNVNVDHWSKAACSAVAEGLRKNQSVKNLRFYTYDSGSVTPERADILTNGIRDNKTIRRLNISWPLASALSYNDTVETVHISGHSISEEGEEALTEALRDNKTLREITIEAFGKFEGKAGKILAEAVAGNSLLRKLSIYDSYLSNKGIIALAEALKTNQAITELSLGDILNGPNPGDAAALAIAGMIRHNTAIKTLCINGRIGETGIQAIAETLKINHTITRLDIKDISHKGAKYLLEALKENNCLEELVVPNLKPDDEDAKLIAEILRKNTGLKVLGVENGTFGDESGVAIANALRENESLKTLDIHGNHNVGIEWAKALAKVLRSNNILENLNIDTCWGMKTEGAIAIIEALENNSSLRSLSMQICPLEVSGARALAGALCNNDTLRYLNIRSSDIGGSEGTKAIAEALKINRSINYISLSGCSIGDNGGIAIGEALKSNKGLLVLDLRCNRLYDRGIEAIAQGLETNDALRILNISSFPDYYDERANRISDAGARSLRKSLEANHSLAWLEIENSYNPDSWYVSRLVSEIAAGLGKNRTLAYLQVAFSTSGNEPLSSSDKKALADAAIASGSKNIINIYPYPDSDEWKELSSRNEDAANALLEKIRATPDELTREDLRNCEERIPAILRQVESAQGEAIQ